VSGVAVTLVGALGTAAPVGVTAFDALDCGPEPSEFTACTLKVYAVPGVRSRTVPLVAGGEPVMVVTACAVVPM
jgi:hypothetical protein